jgi:hypothetical protein
MAMSNANTTAIMSIVIGIRAIPSHTTIYVCQTQSAPPAGVVFASQPHGRRLRGQAPSLLPRGRRKDTPVLDRSRVSKSRVTLGSRDRGVEPDPRPAMRRTHSLTGGTNLGSSRARASLYGPAPGCGEHLRTRPSACRSGRLRGALRRGLLACGSMQAYVTGHPGKHRYEAAFPSVSARGSPGSPRPHPAHSSNSPEKPRLPPDKLLL